MKKIMILGAGILQLPAILKAKELGLYVIVADINPNAIGFKYAHESLIISTIDTDKIVKAALQKKIDGIMTLATDLPVRTVAAVAKKMHLIGVSEETAHWATDKAMMRNRLAECKVPIPAYFKTNNLVDYLKIVKKFKDVFIVKPVDNSGSRGVFLVSSDTEIERAYYYAKNNSKSGEILVEEFMKGREISVETLSIKGVIHVLAITDKRTTGIPNFVEIGHSQPAQFDRQTISRIKRVAMDAVRAIGIENGASHTEIIVTEQGPKIVELGARLAGDCIATHLTPLSTGIDMVGNSIKIAMGEEPDLKMKFSKGSVIRYFQTAANQIRSISGIEKAAAIKGIHEITFTKDIGDQLNSLNNSTDRIGFIIAQRKDVHAAVNACEEAISLIEIL